MRRFSAATRISVGVTCLTLSLVLAAQGLGIIPNTADATIRGRLEAFGQGPDRFGLVHADTRLAKDVVIEPHVVFGPGVVVEEGAVVQGAVLHDNVRIGRGAVVRRAILDKNVVVPPGATIGVNRDRDRELYHISQNGITALGKGQRVT